MLRTIAAGTRLWVAHHTGTRGSDDWAILWENTLRTLDPAAPLPLIASDSHDPIHEGLARHLGVWTPVPRRPGPGRPANPVRRMPTDLMYVQVCKRREGHRVVEVRKDIRYGDPDRIQTILDQTGTTINTSFVERDNLTTRTWNRRFTRRGINFSKDAVDLEASIHLGKVHRNFIHQHPALRKRRAGPRRSYDRPTPAMAAGITDHRWTWLEILQWRPPG